MSQQYPLAGVRVLDLSRILAGPLCTQVLADLGADVVKIERSGVGDDTRQWGPPFLDEPGSDAQPASTASGESSESAAAGAAAPLSAYFISINRGKRSVALDLQNEEARALLQRLIAEADVLVENFLPDALAKFGLEPEQLAALNPRLVQCSISAFGRTGPAAAQPGYDLMIQAASGLMGITGEPAGAPMKVGVAITDVLTGLYAAISVLSGLTAQGRRGAAAPGYVFDLALADCTLASLVNVAQSTLLTGHRPQRYGNAHPQIVPYEAFATSDGYLALAIGADRQWARFCEAVGEPQWATDARFVTNPQRVRHRAELIPQVERLMRDRSTAQWQALLLQIEIPHAPVLPLDETLAAPQVAAREMVATATDSQGRQYRVLGSPIQVRDVPPRSAPAAPLLGEHTAEVLRQWLDCDEAELARLRTSGALG